MSEGVTIMQPGSKPVVAVAPEVAAVIGDPGAPTGVMQAVPLPDSIPRELGFWAAIRVIYHMTRKGAGHLEALRQKYGEIYGGMSPSLPLVEVHDPDEVQKILRNEDQLWSTAMGWDNTMFERLDPAGGNAGSLLSLDFDPHRAARKLFQPAFTSKAMRGYAQIGLRRIDVAVPEWLERGRIDFKPEVRKLLAAVASDIFTGISDPRQIAHVDRALTDTWHGPQALIKDARWSPGFRRARRGYTTLKEFFTGLARERREGTGSDLFTLMCRGAQGEAGDEALARLFITIMLAAYDTTSAAVTSMAYLLAKHQDWQERLRSEAQRVPDDALEGGGLQSLEQFEWAWKESLRLYPVTSSLPRRSLRATTILGHQLAPGTYLGAAIGPLGLHAAWWKNPLAFDPERFSPERAEDKRHPAIFLPFGGGAHACIGMQLATLEAKLLFHRLLTRCRFELAPDYEARHTYTPLGCVSGKVGLRLARL
ncbi:MAG: cytochrome P450 [Myxococcales bacterium]